MFYQTFETDLTCMPLCESIFKVFPLIQSLKNNIKKSNQDSLYNPVTHYEEYLYLEYDFIFNEIFPFIDAVH